MDKWLAATYVCKIKQISFFPRVGRSVLTFFSSSSTPYFVWSYSHFDGHRRCFSETFNFQIWEHVDVTWSIWFYCAVVMVLSWYYWWWPGGRLVLKLWYLRSFIKSWSRRNYYHVTSSKRRLLSSIQILQSISDSRQLTLTERNHLHHLFRHLRQIQASEETM